MSRFLSALTLVPQDDGIHWAVEWTPFGFEDSFGRQIWVPVDTLTDLASIPRLLWAIYPPFGRYTRGAVLHDWLYTRGDIQGVPITKRQADAVFYEAMRCGGVRITLAWAIWAMVAAFAGPTWLQYRAQDALCR